MEYLVMKWISYFGAHKRILSDGGQEFQNEEMAEFTKKWGIELSCTANESSQTKGKYKKVLGLLKEIMRKLKEESAGILEGNRQNVGKKEEDKNRNN